MNLNFAQHLKSSEFTIRKTPNSKFGENSNFRRKFE